MTSANICKFKTTFADFQFTVRLQRLFYPILPKLSDVAEAYCYKQEKVSGLSSSLNTKEDCGIAQII